MASYVFTHDLHKADAMAKAIEAGNVILNHRVQG
jgi:acyl-CoA reductase-like NAD-dependent aldehyde dehydrogenase